MNSELLSETVTVEKEIRVGGVPDMPSWIYGGQSSSLILAPEWVHVTWIGGQLDSAVVFGPRRLKAGKLSESGQKHDRRFSKYDEWPDWLRNLVDEYAPKEQP